MTYDFKKVLFTFLKIVFGRDITLFV